MTSFLLRESIFYAKENGSKLYVCFLDVKKAFDCVWHDGLFYKLYNLVHVEWESRAIFLTIYDDLYKTYLWGICITLNLFVALTSASGSISDVINMAAI